MTNLTLYPWKLKVFAGIVFLLVLHSTTRILAEEPIVNQYISLKLIVVDYAPARADWNAPFSPGDSSATRMEMMAITTNSSISVKADAAFDARLGMSERKRPWDIGATPIGLGEVSY
jgi:hypothetical protein